MTSTKHVFLSKSIETPKQLDNSLLDTMYDEFDSIMDTLDNAVIKSKMEVIDYIPIETYFIVLDKIYFERIATLVSLIFNDNKKENKDLALDLYDIVQDIICCYNRFINRANKSNITPQLRDRLKHYSGISRMRLNYLSDIQHLI